VFLSGGKKTDLSLLKLEFGNIRHKNAALVLKTCNLYRRVFLMQHIAELFIWVFIWVCFQYDDEKLLSKENWLAASEDAFDYQKIKCSFVMLAVDNRTRVPLPPQPSWKLCLFLLTWIASLYVEEDNSVLEMECIFWTWFEVQLPSSIQSIIHLSSSLK
jgi:hypothetical protein